MVWAELGLLPSFNWCRSSDKFSEFPKVTQQANIKTKTQVSLQVQNLTIPRDARGWCSPGRKELLVCPTFGEERANAVVSHCAEWILISWFFFFGLLHFPSRLCFKVGQRLGDNIPRGRVKIRTVEMTWVSSTYRDKCHLTTSLCLEKQSTPNFCEAEKY